MSLVSKIKRLGLLETCRPAVHQFSLEKVPSPSTITYHLASPRRRCAASTGQWQWQCLRPWPLEHFAEALVCPQVPEDDDTIVVAGDELLGVYVEAGDGGAVLVNSQLAGGVRRGHKAPVVNII